MARVEVTAMAARVAAMARVMAARVAATARVAARATILTEQQLYRASVRLSCVWHEGPGAQGHCEDFSARADFFVCSGFFLLLMAQLSSLLSTASSTSTLVLATPIRTSPSLRLDSQPYHPATDLAHI